MPEPVISLHCPSCGGSIKVNQKDDVATCKYCKSSLIILEQEPGADKFFLKRKISPDTAKDRLRKMFKSTSTASDMSYQAQIKEVNFYYAPLWYVSREQYGLMCKKITERDGRKKCEVEPLMVHHYLYVPAISIEELGLNYINSFREENYYLTTEFPEDEPVQIMEPIVSLSECFTRVERIFKAFDPKVTLKREVSVIFDKIVYDKKDAFLLLYPVYFLKYKYKNTNYNISIDGFNGEVLYGRFPQADEYKIMITLAVCSVFSLIMGFIIPNFGNIFDVLKEFATEDPAGITFIIIALVILIGMLVGVVSFLERALKYTSEMTIKGGRQIEDFDGNLPDMQIEFNRGNWI